jgi:hypothetical protein
MRTIWDVTEAEVDVDDGSIPERLPNRRVDSWIELTKTKFCRLVKVCLPINIGWNGLAIDLNPSFERPAVRSGE